MANILCARNPEKTIPLNIAGPKVLLTDEGKEYAFTSAKNFQKKLELNKNT